MTSVRTNSKIKEGSNLVISIINLEFHFTKLFHSVKSKNGKNSFQSNDKRFAATT